MDIPADVLVLCADAAKVLVGRMAGDLWGAAFDRFTKLFAANGEHRQQERLTKDYESLRSAADDQRQLMSERITANWTTRLQDLVEEHPEAAADLLAIVEELKSHDNSLSSTTSVVVTQEASRRGQNIYSGRDTNYGRR